MLSKILQILFIACSGTWRSKKYGVDFKMLLGMSNYICCCVFLILLTSCAMNETIASLPMNLEIKAPQKFVLENGLQTSRQYSIDENNNGYYLFSICSDGFPYFPEKKINLDYVTVDLKLYARDSLLLSYVGRPTTDPIESDFCACYIKYQTFPKNFNISQKMTLELLIDDPNELLDMAYNPRLTIKAGNWVHK